MTYQIQNDPSEKPCAVCIVGKLISIPFDPANTDYQQFKQAINDDTAQLEDATGVVMSPDEAKAFVATLP